MDTETLDVWLNDLIAKGWMVRVERPGRTPDHVLTPAGNVALAELNRRDYVAISKYLHNAQQLGG